MERSPFLLAKQLELQVNSVLSALDTYALETSQQKLVVGIKRLLTDARLDVRDYELSETRAEQLKHAKIARERLEAIRRDILAASEHNIFGAADVAQLTAQIEEIASHID